MANMQILVNTDWHNPEADQIEIVERKGLGHPDTLADGLAETISIAYSRYCLDRFGVVLHHNLDKLYIGAGLFKRGFGYRQMIHPVQVRVNGRISDVMGDESIPVASIAQEAIYEYLGQILPYLLHDEIKIDCNSTQFTKNPRWFSPRDINDLPEASVLKANDTSVCVAHWPFTTCERLAFELEKEFWEQTGKSLTPKYPVVGQDIKVMVQRLGHKIEVTVCMPMISHLTPSLDYYLEHNALIEDRLNSVARVIASANGYDVSVRVNPAADSSRLVYLLATGSCIDCGEEGVVGRGNTNQGVISCFRSHSMEAPAGKNPVYHTGRVMGFLTTKLARAIYEEFGVQCTITALTRNGHSLIPPSTISIQTSAEVDKRSIEELMHRCFDPQNYLRWILEERMVR